MTHLLPVLFFLVSCGSGGDAVPGAQDPHMSATSKPARPRFSKSGHDLTPLTRERIAEINKTLTPEQIRVTQHAGTEPPFCGKMVDQKEPGIYVSVVGGLPLFRSTAKFHSGTGWPSFFEPYDPEHIIEKVDRGHGMVRTEIVDARSGAHLGHVFDDGPPPTGKRYCVNEASLRFIPDGAELPPESRPVRLETAYFAGGCFWGVEDVFGATPGVLDAVSGYQGGTTENPTYEEVCGGRTGHAETVKVVYDAGRVSYEDLLRVFFANHDPTTMDRQGPDVGSQYRSAIFAATPDHLARAREYVKQAQASPAFSGRKIVTQVALADSPFYEAEDYHQDYNVKHGRSCGAK
jgi:peptide methionine sulfoxide reductase msrA/msrB